MRSLDETFTSFAEAAERKAQAMRADPLGFTIAAAFAGAYVGAGILLIFSVGEPLQPAWRPLVMGASFGIALTLVVFAGSELFTGHTLSMTVGRLTGRIDGGTVLLAWVWTWIGNLLGALLLSALFVVGGSRILAPTASLLREVALHKAESSAVALLARSMLCNWLVCLALWTSERATGDAARCILIFWCLFAFIACGFEHSIANMTIFATAYLSGIAPTLGVGAILHNLFWVSLGNAVAGAVVLGWGYARVLGAGRGERGLSARTAREGEHTTS